MLGMYDVLLRRYIHNSVQKFGASCCTMVRAPPLETNCTIIVLEDDEGGGPLSFDEDL